MAISKEEAKEMEEQRREMLEGDPNADNGRKGQESAELERAQWEAEIKQSKKELNERESEVQRSTAKKPVENTPFTRPIPPEENAVVPTPVDGDADTK